MPEFQYPDLLGSYLRGRMAPLQLQAAQQQNVLGGLQAEQLRMTIDRQRKTNDVVDQMLNQASGQAPGGPTGGIQSGPQASSPSALDVPNSFSPSGVSSNGLPFQPSTMMALDLLQGRDPLATATKAQEYQLTQAKLKAQGPLDLMKTLATSDSADRIVMNNPQLIAQWPNLARQLGLDPAKDFNNINVRKAATLAYNNIAGSVGMEAMPMPNQVQTVNGALGSRYEVDPLTGKQTQVKSEESLHQVIAANGQPVLLPASEAAGKQPFNQSIFGAANMSDQAIQFAADSYRTTGKFPTTMGRNPAMQAKVLEKVAADAAAQGDTAASIDARAKARSASGEALKQNQKLLTATQGYLATMDKNLDKLTEVMGKVDTTGSPLINKALRAWQQGAVGDPDVAQYVTYLSSVQGEFAKLKSGSLGNAPSSDSARKEAADVINKYMNTGQIQALKEAMHQEGLNRVQSIQEESNVLQRSLGGTTNSPSSPKTAPPGALSYLKSHPEAADQFKAKYGYLP